MKAISLTNRNSQPARQKPVRVGLRRLTCDAGKIYPLNEDSRIWWARLQRALGTCSSDFVNTALFQLQQAARMHNTGINAVSINAALAMIEAAAPANEIEGALALQAACTHLAAMAVLGRMGGAIGMDRHVAAMSGAAAKLLQLYLDQMEQFRRMKSGPSQSIRVEHIHIHQHSAVERSMDRATSSKPRMMD